MSFKSSPNPGDNVSSDATEEGSRATEMSGNCPTLGTTGRRAEHYDHPHFSTSMNVLDEKQSILQRSVVARKGASTQESDHSSSVKPCIPNEKGKIAAKPLTSKLAKIRRDIDTNEIPIQAPQNTNHTTSLSEVSNSRDRQNDKEVCLLDSSTSSMVASQSPNNHAPGAWSVAGIGNMGEEFREEYFVDEPLLEIEAQCVDEEEVENRLREAEEYGRQQILKTVIHAEAQIVNDTPPPDDHSHGFHKKAIAGCVGILLIIVVLVTIITFKNKNSTENAPSQRPSSEPSQIPSSSPTNPPENFHCYQAHAIGMDGSILVDSLYDRAYTSNEDYGALEECSEDPSIPGPLLTDIPTAWYLLRGNGMAVTLTFCGLNTFSLSLYSGKCEEGDSYPSPKNCIGSTVELKEYCATRTWQAEEGRDYYIVVFGRSREATLRDFSLSIHSNANCESAFTVKADGSLYLGDTIETTTQDEIDDCGYTSYLPYSGGIWYRIIGNGQAFAFDTCKSSSYDTLLSVYSGTCGNLTCAARSDSAYNCGQQSAVAWISIPNQIYYIRVRGTDASFGLTGRQLPPNRMCLGAHSLLEPNATASGTYTDSTRTATDRETEQLVSDGLFFRGDNPLQQCSTYTNSSARWYKIEGIIEGATISIDTCDSTATTFHPRLAVLEGPSCDDYTLSCTQNVTYDSCEGDVGNIVTWIMEQSTTYYIFVYGEDEDDTGNFVLNWTIV